MCIHSRLLSNQQQTLLAHVRVWKSAAILDLALQIGAITHGCVAKGLGPITQPHWLAARLCCRAVVQCLGALDLCARLGVGGNGTSGHLLHEAADFACYSFLH